MIGFTALGELIGGRDCRGDGFAVPEWPDYLDALLRIAGAGSSYPSADTLLAQAVEGYRGDENWMLKEFACGGILPGIVPSR